VQDVNFNFHESFINFINFPPLEGMPGNEVYEVKGDHHTFQEK
jgi:hypothetical protein